MARLLLGLWILAFYGLVFSQAQAQPISYPSFPIDDFNRSSFPRGFMFGAASSAYQVEGGWDEDGKGPSSWDVFTHKHPEKIDDHNNGDVAADSYHLYKEDIKLLKEMNVDAYRFSISWPRILPSGKITCVNEKGIQYYNNLIDNLIANGIKPVITLFHWDIPQALEEEYGGFLSHKIIHDFHGYANLCFKRFGDRVKHWVTFNEPIVYAQSGYDNGVFPPSRCSSWKNKNCTGGDSSTEPYTVMHNMILAHAHATRLYRTKYRARQGGIVGLSVASFWMVPYSDSWADKQATIRAMDFQLGWNLHPLVYGNYPKAMRTLVGNRLPSFTNEQSKLVKGSLDFVGLNYYTATYVKDASMFKTSTRSYSTDSLANSSIVVRHGELIGEQAASSWLHVFPKGLRELLLYLKEKYDDPIIYITENGVDENNNPNLPIQEAVADFFRIGYYYDHLKFLLKAIHDGVKVRGYFGWALVDNFEWQFGYTVRFGLNYVDFKNGRKRYPKFSAKWFGSFLQKKS